MRDRYASRRQRVAQSARSVPTVAPNATSNHEIGRIAMATTKAKSENPAAMGIKLVRCRLCGLSVAGKLNMIG